MIIGVLALGAGIVIGNWFPDIDQRTQLLLHRSIITHGPLIPLIGFAVVFHSNARVLRWFVIGICIGTAVHLCFDLFPRGWQGFALISIPAFGWTPPFFSWLWLGSGTVACVFMAAKLVRNGGESMLFFLALVVSFALIAFGESALWRPMAAIAIAALLCAKPLFQWADSERF